MTIRLLFFVLVVVLLAGCQPGNKQTIPQLDFQEFEGWLQKENDTIYVINFWATWCKPCIEELPEFERINAEYSDKAVKVLLVSLDFPGKYEEQLIPFVETRNIQSEVIHLTDVNANKWIDKVNPSWSGSIPATLIYKNTKKEFFERKMNFDELKTIIELNL